MGTAVGAGVRGMWPGWGAQNHFKADEVIVQGQGLTLGVGDRSGGRGKGDQPQGVCMSRCEDEGPHSTFFAA